MGQFTKFGVLVALGVALAPAAPALAGTHRAAISFHPCRAGCIAYRERLAHRAPAFAAVGIVTGYVPSSPYPDEAPGPYPVGYDGSSATPTGYGGVYNVPPSPNPAPRVIYVDRQLDDPRENGVIIVRGGVVSAAY